jgi:hypothetical protein
VVSCLNFYRTKGAAVRYSFFSLLCSFFKVMQKETQRGGWGARALMLFISIGFNGYHNIVFTLPVEWQ